MTTLPGTVQERISLPPAARGGAGEGSAPVTAGDVLAALRRRSLLIVVLFVLLTAAAGGGFVAWWMYWPGYRSECLIECVSNLPDTGLTLEQERLRQEEFERFVLTQSMLLKGRIILDEVLKINEVRETGWYKSIKEGKEGKEGEHLLELTEQLQSAPVRGTNFLRVSIECRNPNDPAVITNAVVRAWRDAVKKRTADEYAEDLDAARTEERDLDAKINEKRGRLKGIVTRLPAGAIQNPGRNITSQEVWQYGEQAALLQLERTQLEQFRAIYNDPNAPVTAEDRALVEQDPEVAALKSHLFLLEQQRASDQPNFGAGHTETKQLDARISAAQEKLDQLSVQKLRERQQTVREAVNTAFDNTNFALFTVMEQLAKSESALLDQDRMLFDYLGLELEIARDLEYKTELSTYVKDLERVVHQRRAIDISVAQWAQPPLERSTPNLLLLPIAIFFALILSVSTGVGLELLDKSVRTTQDIVRHLDIGMLGAVPDTDDEEVSIERVESALLDVPRSMVAEAFRRIRTNLQFAAPAERQRSVLITSPHPDDGKTTVACNLAIAVAQGGRRVLLVDANCRRPGVHKVFKNVGPKGLSNILVGEGSLASYVARTDIPLLEVLSAGPIPPNPAELLGSEQCRTFLEEATASYDQVIIDTPPVLLASDAIVLAAAVDGVILVIRAKANSRGVARRACTLLTDVSARMFGAVLNAAQAARGGYFREQLRTYYDYQAELEPPAVVRQTPHDSAPNGAD